MKPTQTLRDAAILVALVLLATSVRVTALPGSPLQGPQVQAATPVAPVAAPRPVPAAPQLLPSRLPSLRPSVDEKPAAEDCQRLQRLTVRGDAPGELIVIEVEIDPRVRAALGLCPTTDDDPRVPADKA